MVESIHCPFWGLIQLLVPIFQRQGVDVVIKVSMGKGAGTTSFVPEIIAELLMTKK